MRTGVNDGAENGKTQEGKRRSVFAITDCSPVNE